MKTRFPVLVKAEIGVGWDVRDSGGQVDISAVRCAVANRYESLKIIEPEGNAAAARCCDAVTMLLAAQGVVVKVKVNPP
jgi:hypothetical protein